MREFIKRSERVYNMSDTPIKSEIIKYRKEVENYYTFIN